jgi:hypothetical protein
VREASGQAGAGDALAAATPAQLIGRQDPAGQHRRGRRSRARPRCSQLAGHDVNEVLDRVTQKDYRGARSVAAVLHGRVAKLGLEQGGTTTAWAERTPALGGQSASAGEWRRALEETVAALDHRQRELGLRLLGKPEPWAVRYLGLPPKERGRLRNDWLARAGQVASYREAAGHSDPEQAVGPYPARNPELAEAWKASARALEMPEEERARSLPRGALESRVRTYERARAAAPRPVTHELQSTAQAEKDASTWAWIARTWPRRSANCAARAGRAICSGGRVAIVHLGSERRDVDVERTQRR